MTTAQIYAEACHLYRKLTNEINNRWNGCPSTTRADVDALANRCRKAYSWAQANDKGYDYKAMASNFRNRAGFGINQGADLAYEAIINGADLWATLR